jgi:hydroxyacylglutathione hydrolase
MQQKELLTRLGSKKPPVVVDVRTGFEYRNGHIPDAIHAPGWKLLLRIATLPQDRQTELVGTCEHGPRAEIAKRLLMAQGYTKVVLLDGHMAG